MAQQYINIGTVPNDGTGDVMRVSFTKVDNNFSELYTSVANLTANLENISGIFINFGGEIQNKTVEAYNTANAAFNWANGIYFAAQTSFVIANTANAAWAAANASYDLISSTSDKLNVAYLTSNSAFGSVNSVGTFANSINSIAYGATINAAAAFDQANALQYYVSSSFDQSNSTLGLTVSAVSGLTANTTSAYNYANNIGYQLRYAFGVANAGFNQANAAIYNSNYVGTVASGAYAWANAAYSLGSAAIPKYNGIAYTSFRVQGSLSVDSSATFGTYSYIDGNGGVFRTGGGNYGIRIYPGSSGSGILQFTDQYQSTQWGSVVVNGGALSLGTDINTPVYIRTNGTNIGLFNTGGFWSLNQIWASNDITAYYGSDIKLKENVTVIENAINKVKKIRGVEFDWTDDYIKEKGGEDGYFVRKHDVGVIAQEIERVLPEAVAVRENGIKAVKYEKIIVLLIEAIKEQQKKIEALESKIG